jgi:ribulose-phosphate 3-epimerase
MTEQKIIPTVFVLKGGNFKDRFNKMVPISDNVQIDFMDGQFVKSQSIDLKEIPDLKNLDNVFTAHLMVKYPQNWMPDLARKGFKKVIFHYESQPNDIDIKYLVALAQRHDLTPILALNPDTSVHAVEKFKGLIKEIMLMAVNPGKEGQKFNMDTLKKIKVLKENKFIVSIDGGLNYETAAKLGKAGCDYAWGGSFLANSDDPKEVLKKLETIFNLGEYKETAIGKKGNTMTSMKEKARAERKKK